MAVHEQPLVVCVDVLDGSATVAVQGEIDMATVADLPDGLAKALGAVPSPLMVGLARRRSSTAAGCPLSPRLAGTPLLAASRTSLA